MAVTPIVIREIWRYPIKSLGGERLGDAEVEQRIVGDREFGVFDAASGKLLSAKSVAALLTLRARWNDGQTQLSVSEDWLSAQSPAGVAALCAAVGRPVSLRRVSPDDISHIDMEVDDGVERAAQLATFETQPGMLFDSRSPLHLVSRATLESLGRDHQPGAADVRRYRPNLVVDGIAALAEDAWVGRSVMLGTVMATVRCKTERCVLTSRRQPAGVDEDRSLLRFLNSQRGFCVGIYLQIERPGRFAVGDAVTLLA
ncbi:MAG: MOSC domain-containing protein [Kofleriaceae bacterium]|nr:MOSC domain-containing protein [Kofleriaceae bacterium]